MQGLYGKGREGFLGCDIDWDADVIKLIAVDASYLVAIDGHEFLTDVPAGARVSTSAALTSKSKALGVAGAANTLWDDVVGNEIVAVVCFQDTGVEATSRLIYFDNEANGLPVTPNGGDINFNFDTGPNKIFKL